MKEGDGYIVKNTAWAVETKGQLDRRVILPLNVFSTREHARAWRRRAASNGLYARVRKVQIQIVKGR